MGPAGAAPTSAYEESCVTVATHRRTVEVLEAPQYEGEVVSATSEHALIVLPDW